MRSQDIMATIVITISGNTTVNKAEETISKPRIRRLPAVGQGKIAGIIRKDGIMNAGTTDNIPMAPRKRGTLPLWRESEGNDIKGFRDRNSRYKSDNYCLLAQGKRVGGLPLMDNDKMAGILTTNDVFYKVLNLLPGIRKKGDAIHYPRPR